jgi:para-aminobenzoate synthetase component 1
MSSIHSIFFISNEMKLLHAKNPVLAKFHYAEHEEDLLTQKTIRRPLKKFLKQLEQIQVNYTPDAPHVFHFYYEMGHLFHNPHLLRTNDLLAIEIQYADFNFEKIDQFTRPQVYDFKPYYNVGLHHYQEKFHQIQKHLMQGDCYQVNLTFPGTWKIPQNLHPLILITEFFSRPHLLSAYAHTTHIPERDLLLLSNSPECLFGRKQCSNNEFEIYSMPIKGTIKYDLDQDLDDVWNELIGSEKEQAELYMIADLIRSDLSRIEKPRARIIAKKKQLTVPGLLHQYSLLSVKTSRRVHLLKLLKSLFPGGSITGAPKKRVMQIIESQEIKNRKFYCGSTLLMHRNQMQASINIRSAEFDFNERDLTLSAGGGITLASDSESEYQEMLHKIKSFFSVISA